jgi:hypothetical protein
LPRSALINSIREFTCSSSPSMFGLLTYVEITLALQPLKTFVTALPSAPVPPVNKITLSEKSYLDVTKFCYIILQEQNR